MKQCKVDHSIFTKFNDSSYIILAVYVNDIVITENDAAGIDELNKFIETYFHTKDLENLKYLLEIEVTRSKQDINLC